MEPPLYVPVILGTVREGRESEAVARWVVRRIADRPGMTTRLVDPRDEPWAGNLVERAWEMHPQPPEVAAFAADMVRADAFVIVTPEYNYGLPGALKNLLDHLYDAWNRKPFAMVTTGGASGGLRAAGVLRQVVSGLGACTVPASLSVPFVARSFDERGPVGDVPRWNERLARVLDEVAWYGQALRQARTASVRAEAQAANV